MIEVVLAEDHKIVREGFRAILEGEGFHVVGEAGDGLEALRLVEELRPDVLILDLMMPGLNGLEVARRVRQQVPETSIIVLSMHSNEAYVLEALRNGASGYVLKSAGVSELKTAVREVLKGREYLSASISEQRIKAYMEAETEEEGADPYALLTDREREIFQLTVEGHSSREIGERLFISPRTVDKHRSNILSKLGIGSKTGLLQYALQRGQMLYLPSRKDDPPDAEPGS